MYYIGLDVHKKSISFCVKMFTGNVQFFHQMQVLLDISNYMM